MNKLYTLLATLMLSTPLFAQNVLLYEDFEAENLDHIFNYVVWPSGNDQTWINADIDYLDDQSGAGRPGEWFLTFGFADVDSANTVMASNSWTLDPTPVANYLILPPIHLDAADGMLYWKNAPFQTPRFLDGLQVLVSTTDNMPENFTDTLMYYAEYTDGAALPDDSSFANYNFTSGYVFGQDYTWVEYHGDSARFKGILRPDSASLAAYSGQTIYIAFCHGTVDDNLQSIDDIKVTGTGQNLPVENVIDVAANLDVFPNPAADQFRIAYDLQQTGNVQLNIYDATGRLVKSIANATQLHGHYYFDVNTRDWTNGAYNVVLDSPNGKSTVKINVQK